MEGVFTPTGVSNRAVRGFVAFIFTLVFSLGLSVTARAQATSGDITGIVKDPAGALVVKANVAVTNEDTGVSAIDQTGSAGNYHVSNLLPGKYDVVVTAAGFQPFTLRGVSVELNKTSTADIGLKVGTSASVEVSADAGAVLDTTTTNLTTTFSNVELSDLPTSGIGGAGQSGVLNVSLLSPGVASSGALGIGVGPSIGGQRPRNNNFEIEGVDNNNKAVTGPLVYLPNDAVGSFTLITNQFSPDFGHSSGGQFNSTVVSGTNTFHGRVYEYFQNRNLNAESGIAGGKIPNPDYDNNRYGGQVGGPIVKDHLFFFGSFERNKIGQDLSSYVCVPTSVGMTQLNTLATSYGFNANNLAEFIKYTPPANFLGQGNATTGIDAASDNACGSEAKVNQYLPVTNGLTGSSALTTNIPLGNYLFSGANPTLFNALTTSVDYTISSKDSLRGRYIQDWQSSTDYGLGQTILPEFYTTQPFKWYLFALSEYHTFTPNLTNEFRIGFNRFSNTETAGSTTYPGLNGVFPELNYYDMGNLQLGADGNAPQFTIQNLYQATDNISWVRGKHTFKIGFDGRKYISPQGFTQRARGDYEWNVTDQFLHDLAPDQNGFAERSSGSTTYYGDQTALYGYGNDTWRVAPTVTLNVGLRYEFTSVPTGERAQQLNILASVPGLVSFNAPQPTYTSFAPRLGISWAPDEKTSVRAGAGIAYDVLFDNLGTLSFPPQYSVTEDVGTTVGYPFLAPNFLKNGGLPAATGAAIKVFCLTGTGPGTSVACNPDIAGQRAATSAYLPNQVLPYSETWTLTVQRIFGNYTAEIGYIGDKGIHLPVQDQINVQTKVTPTNELGTLNPTGILESPGSGASTLGAIVGLSNLVPAWKAAGFTSKITSYQPYGYSNYNGLVANVTRRFQKGLQMNLSYTWSKTMDDSTDEVFATVLTPRRQQDHQCIKCDYSRSALDRTHRITFEVDYEVQAYKNSDNFLLKNGVGNWVISPIYTYESPEYATVLSGDNANLNGDTGAAIDRSLINPRGLKGTGAGAAPIVNPALQSACSATAKSGPSAITSTVAVNGPFNVCQNDTTGYSAGSLSSAGLFTPSNAYYVQSNLGTLPNGGRNTLPVRPINNWDLTLYKRFTVAERYSLSVGAAALNLFNHPQYIPGSVDTVNGPSYTANYNFQTVTNAFFNHPEKEFLNNSRNMSLSAKFDF